jgi:pimeloyl-ACP methyl ester carboxylesterase/ketosteroid isomerase-like protein
MRYLTIVLCLLLATSVQADAGSEVRAVEIAFAKAFAERDQAKFFSFIDDDATFLSPRRTLRGKAEVAAVWSAFFEGPVAPFSWGPDRVSVSADGTLGLTNGPVYGADGKIGGAFMSTWRKKADGTWKIVFDGSAAPPAFASENPAVEQGFITADDGVKLHYRKVGRAPLTVVVPLGFVLHDSFRQLADIATVVTYDMRNRGRSDRVEDVNTLTIQQDVRDLEALRRQLKIDKFVPIGYSYLGLMVVLYALDHPDRVARIVQIGPVPVVWDEFEGHTRADSGVPEAAVTRLAELRKQAGVDQRALCEAEFAVSRYMLVGNPAHHTRLSSNCEMPNEWPANFARQLESHWGSVRNLKIPKSEFKKVTVPVLTIHGTKDRNAAYAGGQEWSRILPNATLVTVDGAAHAAYADDPVTVFGSIRAFLRGD